ncbi:hypothetical protein MKW94_001308, partial [Papaver nudicaule]|nr:hypothetical protein [Papaver nudicaule]
METVIVEILMVVTGMMIIIEEEVEVMKTFSLAREVGVLINIGNVVLMTMVAIRQEAVMLELKTILRTK